MALQIGTGTPAASLGSDGDYYLQFDSSGNRYFVGPKASGAWPASTFYSLQGPCGPALLSGKGAPASSTGSVGQGYVDLSTGLTYAKTASGWGSAIGSILGPQGVAGPSGSTVPALGSTCYAYGPNSNNAAALALSSSVQYIPAPGSSGQPGYFIPYANCTMVSALFVLSSLNSPGATTFSLYEVNTGNTLYSYTVSTYGTVATPTMSVALNGGYTYAWQVKGSGNAFVQATPILSQPSTQPMGISYAPLFSYNASSAPTTAYAMPVAGTTTISQYMSVPKTGFLYGVACTNTAGADATIGLYNSAGTLIFSTVCSANTVTPNFYGPYGLASNTQLAAGYYTWRVTCAAAGYFSVLPQVFL